MTWVVGMPTMFGYSLAISDIRVTLANDAEHDCLQKIYPVGRFIALGFAGSVRIGFAMCDRLADLLHCDDLSRAWDPTMVAEWWPKDAREVFERHSKEDPDLRSHLMMVSVDPNKPEGAPWVRARVHTFRSPGFEAVELPPKRIAAIGCGESAEPCRKAIEALSNNEQMMFDLMQAEVGVPGGIATVLGFDLTQMLRKEQPKGISSHLHYCWVYPERIIIKTNDHISFGPQWSTFDAGSGILQQGSIPSIMDSKQASEGAAFRMPTIARSWAELVALLDAAGAQAEGCST